MRYRQNKYGAKRVKIDGYNFDSILEARRYEELKLLGKAGEISHLKVHPVFPIKIKGVHVCDVELDFYYQSEEDDISYQANYEDCKGADTAISKLKRKLFEAYYHNVVTLIRATR